MKKFALIVAAGSGTRMGSPVPKQFLLLHQKPLFVHTMLAFLETFADLKVVLVLPAGHLQTGNEHLAQWVSADRYAVATGGETRFHSVQRGLQLVDDDSICFVHDAVRCMVSAQLIIRCYETALAKGNAIPAIPPTDSLRIETAGGTQTLDRSKVKLIQTPQTFESGLLKKAFAQSYDQSFTDEASVVEKTGSPIYLVDGESTNIKITTPLDMIVAGKLLEGR